MKKKPLATFRSLLVCALLALATFQSAHAAPIEIDNFSFELPELGAGGWNNNLEVWLGRDGVNSGDSFIEFIGGFRSEGNQHIGMANGYYVIQNTGIPYAANTLYTLTVGVGYRNANQSGAESVSILGLTVLDEPPGEDNILDGVDANDQLDNDEVLAANAVSVDSVALNSATVHTFTDVTVEFATNATPPEGNIVIFLGDDAGGARSHYDNVRLDAVSNEDPDGDEIPTEWETGTDRGVARGLDPAVDDGGEDPDGDGLTNFMEFEKGTHPQLADTDDDGINDNLEIETDPLNPDSDGDTLKDGAEIAEHKTDPNNPDSDGDEFEDQAEVSSGSDPLLKASQPVDEGEILLGVNFVGGGPGVQGASVTGSTGIIPHGNWNNLDGGAGAGSSTVGFNGEPTLMRVSWSTNGPGTRGSDPDAGNGDDEVMFGLLLPRGVNGLSEEGEVTDDVDTKITVRNIPYPMYDLYVFASSEAGGEGDYLVMTTKNGDAAPVKEVRRTIVDIGFDGSFVEAPEEFSEGNYLYYPGLSGSTLTIKAGGVTDGAGGINGFQIVRATTDTDGDGMPDVWEEANGLDPETNDAAGDKDEDGATNLAEFQNGTNPQDNDSDNDGLLDGVETGTGTWVDASNRGTNPLSADTDKDGLKDNVETNTGAFVSATDTGTDPLNADTDGDGSSDSTEIAVGTNPFDPASFPPFPVPIGYWSFDDGNAETADLVGENPGTVNGGATFVEGHTGSAGDQAIQFDGIDSSVTTEASLGGLDAFSMSGWVNFDVDQAARTGLYGQNDVVEFGMINATTIELWDPTAGALQVPFGPATDGWAHIAVVSDENGRIIYINGENVADGGAGVPTADGADLFNIGGDGIQDATGNFFEGEIDDVAIWDLALSEDEVKQLASGSISPLGTPPGSAGAFQVTKIELNAATRTVTLTFPSLPGASYAGEASDDLVTWTEFEDTTGEGAETTLEQQNVPAEVAVRYYRVQRTD